MKEWLQAADVFASPCRSRWAGLEVEGFGIVFAEAALAGLPVIAGDSGGAPEAVVQGETGLVVDGHSVQQVAAALASILRRTPEQRRDHGRQGTRAGAGAAHAGGRRRALPRAAAQGGGTVSAARRAAPRRAAPARRAGRRLRRRDHPHRRARHARAHRPAARATWATARPARPTWPAASAGRPAPLVLALDALKAYAPATVARLAGAGDNEVAAIGISAMCGAHRRRQGARRRLGARRRVRHGPRDDGHRLRAARRRQPAAPSRRGRDRHGALAAAHQPRAAPQPAPRARAAAAHHRALRGAPARARPARRCPTPPRSSGTGSCSTGTNAEQGRRVRVGLVSPYSWTVPGGVNHHVEHLAEELEERGHETWIIAPVGAADAGAAPRRQPPPRRWPSASSPWASAMPVPSNGSRRLRELLAADRRRAWTAPSATAASTCCTCTSRARRRSR